MSNYPRTSFSLEERLNEVIAAYIQAVDAGKRPSQQEILAQHPDLAGLLKDFFADHDRMRQAAVPFQPANPAEAPTLAPGGAKPADGALVRVRYFGDYELLEEISRGGMGVVYKARQVSLKRIVALKMILAGQFASEADVQRFRLEAEAAANLDHPNIVPIYEVGEHEGQHYFSMKLVEGPNLAQWIAECRSQIADLKKDHQSAISGLMATVARAVHYAHQRGILHRDLKPGNILLQCPDKPPISDLQFAIPMVTDFGLAKRLESDKAITESGAIVGTPSYMAPEQASAKKGLSTSVDVYSLGAILYELLTGRPPFRAEAPLDTLMELLEKEPIRPRTIAPGVDRDVETITLKCLQKDPRRRYGSAEALAEDLERWHRREPIQARRSAAWERALKWTRRRPAAAALLAVLAVVLPIAFILVTLQWLTARQAQRATAKQLYYNHVALAAREYEADHRDQAVHLLDDLSPAEFRDWEWRYVRNLCRDPPHVSLTAHHSPLACLAISPDGRRFATAAGPEVGVWEVATRKNVSIFSLQNAAAVQMTFSSDGGRLGINSVGPESELSVRVHDAETGRKLLNLPGVVLVHPYHERAWLTNDTSHDLSNAAFSRDGKYLFAIDPPKQKTRDGCFSVNRGSRLGVWDLASGLRIRTCSLIPLSAHEVVGSLFASSTLNRALAVSAAIAAWQSPFPVDTRFAFSSDRTRVAVCNPLGIADVYSRRQNSPRLFTLTDIYTGRHLVPKAPGFWTHAMAFGPDDQSILFFKQEPYSPGAWRTNTEPRLRALESSFAEVYDVRYDRVRYLHTADSTDTRRYLCAISPGATYVAYEDEFLGMHLFNTAVPEQEPLLVPAFADPVRRGTGMAFSPDGHRLAIATGETPNWFFPQAAALASASKVRIWETTSGRQIRNIGEVSLVARPLCFSPDGGRLFVGGEKRSPSAKESLGEVQIWNAVTPDPAWSLTGHTAYVERLAISADGPYAASASAREVRVWDLTTRRELATIDRKADVAALAMSPDGKWLGVYGKNGKGEIYESLSGKPAHGRVRANIPSVSGNVTHVLSPSREFEAFSTQDMSKAGPLRMEVEATVRVVRPRAGDAAMVIKPAMEESQGQEHPLQSAGLLGRVSAISKPAFSADSTLLAAGCSDGTVRVWTSKDGKEIMRLGRHQGMVNAVAFGPNGQRLFSAGEDGTVKVWDAKSGAEILTLRGHDGPVLDIALASDGQRLLTAGKDKVVRLWDGGPAPTSGMTASPH